MWGLKFISSARQLVWCFYCKEQWTAVRGKGCLMTSSHSLLILYGVWGSWGEAPSFFTLVPGRSDGSASRPSRFIPEKEPPSPPVLSGSSFVTDMRNVVKWRYTGRGYQGHVRVGNTVSVSKNCSLCDWLEFTCCIVRIIHNSVTVQFTFKLNIASLRYFDCRCSLCTYYGCSVSEARNETRYKCVVWELIACWCFRTLMDVVESERINLHDRC
jgi:hypothetical protein